MTDVPPEPVEVPRALLLANFDECISHVRDPDVVAEAGGPWEVMMRGLGLLLVDGRLAGRWTRTVRTSHVALQVTPHEPLDRGARDAVELEAQRFGEFLGVPARLLVDRP